MFPTNKYQQCFQHVLYFIKLFAEDSISFDLDSLMEYDKSIVKYFDENHPLDQQHNSEKVLKQFILKKNYIRQEIQKYHGMKRLKSDRIDGTISENHIPLIHYISDFGSAKRSRELQETIQKMFVEDESKFEPVVTKLNNFLNNDNFEKFHDRCLKEISESYIKCYLSNDLVDHMCEMYNYGFIKKVSFLPKPAVYISYLSQLLLNIKCSVKK